MLTLRPYQQEAIDAVIEARRAGAKRLLISLPTGAGKTVIFSRLASMAKRDVIVLAHREELLEQAKQKIERVLEHPATVEVEQGQRSHRLRPRSWCARSGRCAKSAWRR